MLLLLACTGTPPGGAGGDTSAPGAIDTAETGRDSGRDSGDTARDSADTARDTARDTADTADTADTGSSGPCTDLNCDGWPDVVVSSAMDGPARVFWGSPDGFSEGEDLPVVWTKGNAQVDLDLDGDLDLVMARLMVDGASFDHVTESYLLYTESVDPYTVRVETLPTNGAHGAAAGDLDGDGYPEVVFTNHGDSYETVHPAYVYTNGPSGFSADAVLELPAIGGHGASVADVDGDGLLDLVVSNYYDGRGRVLPSYVYLNTGAGLSPDARLELLTVGARGNVVTDVDGDGLADILVANHYDGVTMALDSAVHTGASGFAETLKFSTVGAHTPEAADCDNDGDVEIFWANQRDSTSWEPGVRAWYYRGEGGDWSEEPVVLDTRGASGTSARDLDRDGYIDLVVSSFREGDVFDYPTLVYWGGPDCWSDAHRAELATVSADGVSTGPGETGY
jgi:hypothetical protein